MKILGVDPGLANCGWAVVEVGQKKINEVMSFEKKYNLLSYGTIETSSTDLISSRLKKIFFSLEGIIDKNQPDVVSLESQFYSKVAKSMIQTYLSTAMVYLLCGTKNLPLYEYSAKTVKASITGYGSATKFQLKKMVQLLLNLQKPISSEHINDAISVALCYIHTKGI